MAYNQVSSHLRLNLEENLFDHIQADKWQAKITTLERRTTVEPFKNPIFKQN